MAIRNIWKNKRVYLPYLLTCICAAAMFYMMHFLTWNKEIDKMEGGDDIRSLLALGSVVIGIFSFIFLIYSNQFVMKQRKKELALYNILGLEKKHIRRILFSESLIAAALSLVGGCAAGIAGSKLMLLIFLKVLRLPVVFGFYISGKGITSCLCLFGAVFLLILLDNCRRIQMTSPMELLNSRRAGEKMPKARWALAVVGILCTGSGYYLAITTKSPLAAMAVFFLAVLLVTAGTYFLFMAGSIALLTFLKKRKSFYYKTRNFASVSGLIYRMKQNAAGLASICILSTAVLLMVSATVCLYVGLNQITDARFARELQMTFNGGTAQERETVRNEVYRLLKENHISYKNVQEYQTFTNVVIETEGKLEWADKKNEKEALTGSRMLNLLTAEQYENLSGKKVSLKEGEVLFFTDGKGQERESVTIEDQTFRIVGTLKEAPYRGVLIGTMDMYFLIVTEPDFNRIVNGQDPAYAEGITLQMGVDLEGTDEEKIQDFRILTAGMKERISPVISAEGNGHYYVECRQDSEKLFRIIYGGLFFLGSFLGLLFLLATALIIYYKQVSEGYEDRERFQIMQKVGMDKKEVHQSIRRQVWMVFFLPLGMAVLHMAAAFPLVKRLLALMNLYQTSLYIVCTLGTILVFALVYGIIYWITARTYYRIVN